MNTTPRLVRPPLSPNGVAAVQYAKTRRWRIFPLYEITDNGCACDNPGCKDQGKHPRIKAWNEDATTAPDQIRAWWERWPHASIGVAAGSGLVVIDIDPAKGGGEGHRGLVERLGDLGPTLTVRTGSGGLHLYYASSNPAIRNSQARIAPGVDVRAEGGYVVAPPSLHISGSRYAWESSAEAEIVELTQAWESTLLPTVYAPKPVTYGTTTSGSRAQALRYLERADPAIQGQGGSSVIMHVMATIRTMGIATAEDAVEVIEHSGWNGRCVPPWDIDGSQGLKRKFTESKAPIGEPPRQRVEHPPHSADQPGALDVLREARGEGLGLGAREYTPSQVMAKVEPPKDLTPAQALTRAAKVDCDMTEKRGKIESTLRNVCIILRTDPSFAGLRWNEMRLAPELRGTVVDDAMVTRIREAIERMYKFAPGKEATIDALICVADEDRYHPVRDYLGTLKWDGQKRIKHVAKDLLGAEDTEIHQVMTRCFFVGAVARALDPGCKHDCVYVLVGEQRHRKSSFLDALAAKHEWFADSGLNLENKDSYQQIHSAWIYEWAEIDNLTSRAHVGRVKAFCSSRTDTFRPPFMRSIAHFQRAGIICGSANPSEFLADPTGSSRFHTVIVGKRISPHQVREWRDQLWAEAVTIFRAHMADRATHGGDVDKTDSARWWWLTAQEELERAQTSAPHQASDAWEADVLEWCASREDFSVRDICERVLRVEKLGEVTGLMNKRVTDILRAAGYVKGHTKRGNVWGPKPR